MSHITLYAPFNLQQEAQTVEFYVTTSLGATGSFTKSTGSFFTFVSASIEDISYENLLEEFKQSMAIQGLGTWSYGCSFDDNLLWLSSSVGAKVSFNSFTQELLGIDHGTSTASLYYIGVSGPKFSFQSTEKDWSNQSWAYENQIIVREEYCDDGRAYSISNEDDLSWLSNIPGNYTQADWKFVLEDRSNVFMDFSSSFRKNTYEAFHRHVRSYRPFVAFQAPEGQLSASYNERQGTYKLRAENTKFGAKNSIPSYELYFDVDVKTRRLSLGTNFMTSSISGSTDGFMYVFGFSF